MAEASLRERRAALVARTDLHGRDFCRTYAAAADEWLGGVADRASDGNPRRLALLAVGAVVLAVVGVVVALWVVSAIAHLILGALTAVVVVALIVGGLWLVVRTGRRHRG